MSLLELNFLGPPEVSYSGRPVVFRTRKALALLAYLAVQGGAQPREKLTSLLWPDSDDLQGRGSLRNTLLYLREALGDGAGTRLVAERNAIAFQPGLDTRCDWSALRHSLEDVTTLPRGERVERLTAAVSRWRGEFLEGLRLDDADEFEEWLDEQRRAWRQKAAEAFDELSRLHLEAGEAQAAAEAAERWARLDPLEEAPRGRLMSARLALGDRAGVMEDYNAYAALLREELGLQPSPSLRALAERARSLEVRAPHATRPAGETRLVDRAEEHARLVAALEGALAGGVRALLVEGEPGIGKTRLAAEFLAWAGSRGARVLRGRAFATGGRLPYGPVVDALRRGFERLQPEELLEPVWLAELARLLPELAERWPPAGTNEDAAALRLYEAVARLGASLARQGGLVFFLDDLQWADAASLDLLAYAVSRWAEDGAAVLLLLAGRDEGLGVRSQAGAWLSELAGSLPLERLTLDAISPTGVRALVEGLGRESREGEAGKLAEWLYLATSGQPLYLMETLRSLGERQIVRLTTGRLSVDLAALAEEAPVAPGVRETIRSRLARLTPTAFAALQVAAVLGQRFSFSHLRGVLRQDEDEALSTLEVLLGARLLGEGRGDDRLVFTHDRVRDVAYSEISDARRAVLHRHALEVLAESGAPAATLAHHAEAALAWPRAVELHLAAGEAAGAVFAWQEARGHYRRAWSLVRDRLVTSPDGASLERLHDLLFGACWTLGDLDGARQSAEETLAFARTERRPTLECLALNSLARWFMDSGYLDLPKAGAFLAEAEAVSERLGDPSGRVRTQLHLAQLDLLRWERQAALERARAVRAEAEALGESWGKGSTWMIAQARSFLGEWEEAEPLFESARAFSPPGLRLGPAYSRLWAGMAALNAGRVPLALERLREAHAAHEQAGAHPAQRALNAAWLVHALVDGDLTAEALELAAGAHELARLPGLTVTLRAELEIALANAASAAGEGDAAREALLVGRELARALEAGGHLALGRVYGEFMASLHCGVAARRGEWREAAALAREALSLRAVMGNDLGFHAPRLPFWLEVEALLRAGDESAAEEVLARLNRVAGPLRMRLAGARATAVLQRWRGRRDEAVARLLEARDLASVAGLLRDAREVSAALTDLNARPAPG